MIMVVKAAPIRVPATPKREVIAAAIAEASPAAITALILTMGCLLGLLMAIYRSTRHTDLQRLWSELVRLSMCVPKALGTTLSSMISETEPEDGPGKT